MCQHLEIANYTEWKTKTIDIEMNAQNEASFMIKAVHKQSLLSVLCAHYLNNLVCFSKSLQMCSQGIKQSSIIGNHGGNVEQHSWCANIIGKLRQQQLVNHEEESSVHSLFLTSAVSCLCLHLLSQKLYDLRCCRHVCFWLTLSVHTVNINDSHNVRF